MQHQKTKFCLTIFLSFFMANTFAQKILTNCDSIVIPGPKFFRDVYKMNASRLKQIKVITTAPESVTEKPGNFWGNLGEGLLTLATGITTTSSDTAMWVFEDKLAAYDEGYSWGVHLFFPGEYTKERNRVKNDDGSKSIETEEYVSVNWHNGAKGLILENADTIGRFALSFYFRSDKDGQRWLQRLEDESRWIVEKLEKSEYGKRYDDFVVFGNFRGKDFDLITSGNRHRSVIFINHKPVAVFQGPPFERAFGKKNKITPYLLLDKSFEDSGRMDILRLAMFSHLLEKRVRFRLYSL